METNFELYLNTFTKKINDFSSDNVSGNFTATQIMAKAIDISIWAIKELKDILIAKSVLKKYEQKFLEISKKSANTLKVAQNYALGENEVGVSEYVMISYKDILQETETYKEFVNKLKKSIKKLGDDYACDIASNALYELKASVEEFEGLLV